MRAHPALPAILLCAALVSAAHAKTLRYASQFDPGTMDPHAIATTYNARVLNQIYEPLISRDLAFNLEPRLALSWTLVDPKTWRFKLRGGVKFHDGTPFGADDVVFTIERALAPTSLQKITLPNVTGSRRVDELTVEITTSQPTPVLPSALTNLRIVSKAWCIAHKVEKPQNFNAKEETFATRNTNGTGPYMLKRWDADVKTVLVANPHWYGKRGNVDEAEYLVVGTSATRVAGLISGEIDFVIDPAVQDIDRLERVPEVKVAQGMGIGTQFMTFDIAREKILHGDAGGKNPFRDLRVRQAVRYAIDVNALKTKVMRGTGDVGSAMFTPRIEGWDDRFRKPFPYDPERAKALLREAGYPNGFSVTLDCSTQQPADAIGQAITGMLSKVGIRVSYQPLSFNVLMPKLNTRDTSMYVIGWTPATADAEGILNPLAHTKGPRGLGDFNFGGYSSAKVDGLLDRASVELDPPKRRALLTEAMVALDADSAFVPLIYRKIVWAMRKNVKTDIRPNDALELRFVNLD